VTTSQQLSEQNAIISELRKEMARFNALLSLRDWIGSAQIRLLAWIFENENLAVELPVKSLISLVRQRDTLAKKHVNAYRRFDQLLALTTPNLPIYFHNFIGSASGEVHVGSKRLTREAYIQQVKLVVPDMESVTPDMFDVIWRSNTLLDSGKLGHAARSA
jgi:hypothetical protein